MDLRKAMNLSLSVVLGMYMASLPLHLWASDIRIASAEDSPFLHSHYRVIEQAYARIGLTTELHLMPAERSLVAVNHGLYDAELLRIEGIEKDYPNLILLPVKVVDYPFYVIYHKDDSYPPFERIENTMGHLAGYQRGIKFLESRLKGTGATAVSEQNSLIRMVHAKHLKIAFAQGDTILQNQGFYQIRSEQVESIPLYHYIHEKHIDKLDALVQALNEVINAN
jgi:polar amino acid transport system substrate-binding protein